MSVVSPGSPAKAPGCTTRISLSLKSKNANDDGDEEEAEEEEEAMEEEAEALEGALEMNMLVFSTPSRLPVDKKT